MGSSHPPEPARKNLLWEIQNAFSWQCQRIAMGNGRIRRIDLPKGDVFTPPTLGVRELDNFFCALENAFSH